VSKFIEGSKHAAMTAVITDHFFGAGGNGAPGGDSGNQFDRGMTPDWNTSPIGLESGYVNNAPSGASGPSLFNDNIASPKLPRETGVNYTPRSQAGHTVKNTPFEGDANGLAGSKSGYGTAKLIWD